MASRNNGVNILKLTKLDTLWEKTPPSAEIKANLFHLRVNIPGKNRLSFRDEANLRKIDEFLKKKINGPRNVRIRRELLDCLRPSELLHHMPCVYVGTKEKIKCLETNQGLHAATTEFLSAVPAYSGWGIQFLDALHLTGFTELARRLKPGYTPPPESTHSEISNGDDGNYNNDYDGDGATRQSQNASNVLPFEVHPVSSPVMSAPPSYEEAVRVRNPADYSVSGSSLAAHDQRCKLEDYQNIDHDQLKELNACQRKRELSYDNSSCSTVTASNLEQPYAHSSQILSEFGRDSTNFFDRSQQKPTFLFCEKLQSESTSEADSLDLAYERVVAESPCTELAQSNELEQPDSSKSTKNSVPDEIFRSIDSSRFPSYFHRKKLETHDEPELGDKDVKLSCDPAKVASVCENNVGRERDFDQGIAMLSNSSNDSGKDVQVTEVNDLIDLNFDSQPAIPEVNNVSGSRYAHDISTLLEPMSLSNEDLTIGNASNIAGDTETEHTNGYGNLLD